MERSEWSPPGDLDALRSSLFTWFETHRRSFPWRSVDDPWQLLVLEVMSQQTQLDRVTEPWVAFVERWPTPAALADAPRSEVISFWSEHRLGYNRRATYLHESSKQLVESYDGTVPSQSEELQELPGVGPYTANAVASFAFNNGGPVIDTNVKRVVHRAFEVPDSDGAYEDALQYLAPMGEIGRWNGAVMELGGIACGKQPRCDAMECPLRTWCHAYQSGDFTAPDVPTQPAFEGSRRQYRGRVLRVLRERSPQTIEELGPRVKVDFDPTSTEDRAWLQELLEELASDGLVEQTEAGVTLPA